MAGAIIVVEVARRHAFNMLMTVAFAETGVPVPWWVTSCVVNTPARVKFVIRHNVDIQGANAAHACLEVQN